MHLEWKWFQAAGNTQGCTIDENSEEAPGGGYCVTRTFINGMECKEYYKSSQYLGYFFILLCLLGLS